MDPAEKIIHTRLPKSNGICIVFIEKKSNYISNSKHCLTHNYMIFTFLGEAS